MGPLDNLANIHGPNYFVLVRSESLLLWRYAWITNRLPEVNAVDGFGFVAFGIPGIDRTHFHEPTLVGAFGLEPRGVAAVRTDVVRKIFRCTAWRSVAENAAHTLKKGMRVFVAGKLVQRTWQDDAGNKRTVVEIQVTHIGPDLQFQSAEVNRTSAEEKQSA